MFKGHKQEIKELHLLSKLGLSGNNIPEHRAFLSSSFSIFNWITIILLPVAFDIAVFYSMNFISQGWLVLFEFWLAKINIPGILSLSEIKLGFFNIAIPVFELPSSAPDTNIWLMIVGVTVLILLISLKLPKTLMPLSYAMRFAVAIQTSALLFFAIIPAEFSYSISSYLENLIISGVWLIFILPWIHALIYYIFDFSLKQKFTLTLISVLFMIIAIPFQVLSQAILLLKFSLLILPILYIFFGLFFLILANIGLYGWAMSWDRLAGK